MPLTILHHLLVTMIRGASGSETIDDSVKTNRIDELKLSLRDFLHRQDEQMVISNTKGDLSLVYMYSVFVLGLCHDYTDQIFRNIQTNVGFISPGAQSGNMTVNLARMRLRWSCMPIL